MQCPNCGAAMLPGRMRNHPEPWHAQAFGPFGLPLVQAADGEAEVNWVGTREGAEGHVCPDCRTIVLLEEPEHRDLEPWTCPACGEVVPGKFDVCCRCQFRRE